MPTDQMRQIEPPSAGDQPTDPLRPPHHHDWIGMAMKIAFAMLVGVAIWWLVWMWAEGSAPLRWGPDWVRNVVVPAWILGVACLVALRHERHWAAPVQRLSVLLPQVREGKASIEELSQIGGGISELVPQVQDLLHEVRRQHLAVAELNHEIQQRVAVRTDALERQIGALREQAARDPLTGLHNRRVLDTLLPRLLDEARLSRSDLGVLMIDVDHFKAFNDTLGHAAGDTLLRDIGRLIRSSMGENDVAARVGGDEFLILLTDVGADAAQTLAVRLSSLVDALARPFRVPNPPRLSIGTVQLSELGHASAQELLEAADADLYHTKRARRRGAQTRSA